MAASTVLECGTVSYAAGSTAVLCYVIPGTDLAYGERWSAAVLRASVWQTVEIRGHMSVRAAVLTARMTNKGQRSCGTDIAYGAHAMQRDVRYRPSVWRSGDCSGTESEPERLVSGGVQGRYVSSRIAPHCLFPSSDTELRVNHHDGGIAAGSGITVNEIK
eukprot:1129709-Rhodomonas_salina.1